MSIIYTHAISTLNEYVDTSSYTSYYPHTTPNTIISLNHSPLGNAEAPMIQPVVACLLFVIYYNYVPRLAY